VEYPSSNFGDTTTSRCRLAIGRGRALVGGAGRDVIAIDRSA